MYKNHLFIIYILLVSILGTQFYLIKRVNKLRIDMGSTDKYISRKIDKTMGEVYEVQHMIENMLEDNDNLEDSDNLKRVAPRSYPFI